MSKSVLNDNDIEEEVYHCIRLKSLFIFHEGFSSGLDKIGIEAKLQGKWLLSFFSVKCYILGQVHPCYLYLSINSNRSIHRTNVIYYVVDAIAFT